MRNGKLEKVLYVVGANGFIGSHIKGIKQSLDVTFASSGDWEVPRSLPMGSTVLYLRAISSPYAVAINPIESELINVYRTSRYISDCLELGYRVIFSSSDTVYGNRLEVAAKESDIVYPFGLYAEQKNKVESLFRSNPKFLSIRFSIIVGENSKLRKLLLTGEVIEISHPVFRNPVGINDVKSLIEKIALMGNWGSALGANFINCGGDSFISMWELAHIEALRLGVKTPVNSIRNPIDLISRPEAVNLDSSFAESIIGRKLQF
ncbi:MAG: NAD-dependent epimerase/dehydratase family protein [Terrimicrobiaceae bacterium]